jgi:hypothetical protein
MLCFDFHFTSLDSQARRFSTPVLQKLFYDTWREESIQLLFCCLYLNFLAYLGFRPLKKKCESE